MNKKKKISDTHERILDSFKEACKGDDGTSHEVELEVKDDSCGC